METVLAQLCTGTAQWWDVTAVVANEASATVREVNGQLRIVRAGSRGKAASVPICPTLPLHLWRGTYDCVILHEPNPLAATALFCRNPGRRLIVWHHSDLVRPSWAPLVYGRIQRALYRRADCVIVSSPPLAEHSHLVQEAKRVEIIPYGIRLEQYTDLDAKGHVLTGTLKTTHPGPRILFVGRLVYYKGLEVLLHAMTRCTATLLVVGDGPLEGALRAKHQK